MDIIGNPFRMPLQTDPENRTGEFYRFHHLAAGCGYFGTGGKFFRIDRLMMTGIHPELTAAENFRQTRIRFEHRLMILVPAAPFVIRNQIPQIGNDRAAPAAFSSCIPRQIPTTGILRWNAIRTSFR